MMAMNKHLGYAQALAVLRRALGLAVAYQETGSAVRLSAARCVSSPFAQTRQPPSKPTHRGHIVIALTNTAQQTLLRQVLAPMRASAQAAGRTAARQPSEAAFPILTKYLKKLIAIKFNVIKSLFFKKVELLWQVGI